MVVDKLYVAPINGFPLVLCLLHLKDMLIEMLLELLVGQIDAELLKVILLELLEPCKTASGISYTLLCVRQLDRVMKRGCRSLTSGIPRTSNRADC